MLYFPLINIFIIKLPFSFLILLYSFFNKKNINELLKFEYKINSFFYIILFLNIFLLSKLIFFNNIFYLNEIFKIVDLLLFCIIISKNDFKLPKKIHFYIYFVFLLFYNFLLYKYFKINENSIGLIILFLAISSTKIFNSFFYLFICLILSFLFKTYTAAFSILFYYFLLKFKKFNRKILLNLIFFSPVILFIFFNNFIYNILFFKNNQLLKTFLVRLSMWGNNLFKTISSFETIIYGSKTDNTLIFSAGKYFNTPFNYTGFDPHNIFIKSFYFFGIIGTLLVYFVLNRFFYINKLILLTFLLYWTFEPSLGSLQLFCLFYLFFLFNESYKVF